jgi:succinate dehydrogenase/fumarate reductase-like Fe-S protein
MSKHTSGPWHWSKDDDLFSGEDIILDFGCGCCAWSCPTKADKNLIAAAPDLLEALETLLNDQRDASLPALVKARAAIDKAKGES